MLSRVPVLNIITSSNRYFLLKLRKVTGYWPGDVSLYRLALTHKSASYLVKGRRTNNERLEYLGDAILDAVVSDYLYYRYPNKEEGFLTEMRSKMVNGEKLKELAVKLGIAEHIVERLNANIEHSKLYEDAFEAFVGAVYLDKGFSKTYKFIRRRVINQYIDIDELKRTNTNYKSQLIEWSQKTKNGVKFVTTSIRDTRNSQIFSSDLILGEENIGTGQGYTKKEAEQNAAYEALLQLGELE